VVIIKNSAFAFWKSHPASLTFVHLVSFFIEPKVIAIPFYKVSGSGLVDGIMGIQ
jgi:hypothetical protein